MAFSSREVTVAATATELQSPTDAYSDSSTGGGHELLLYNPGPTTVYVGGSDVSTANGTAVASGERLSTPCGQGEKLYGIVDAGTQAVRVFAEGV